MNVNVRAGDSLWYYSQLFGIPLLLLEQSNQDIEPNKLFINQKVQIPGYTLDHYTIKQGDSLWKVSTKFNIALDALYLVNPMINPANLVIGNSILIPYRIDKLIITDVTDYTYEKMMTDIKRLENLYPFISKKVIGHSVMGKDLIELSIGNGFKNVHLNGSFHANEWITTPVIMRFLNEYASSLTNNSPIRGIFTLPLFRDSTLSIVPMVNPDGVNLVIKGPTSAGEFKENVLKINKENQDFSGWKANIHGVDLNNQFPALWEIEASRKPKSPAPRDYPGPYPLSEPESKTMANLVVKENFSRVNAFHTQGEVIYYGFEGLEPPQSHVIAQEYARVSGYNAVKSVDSYAGFKDWFIQDFRKPGFTVELGRGINPLPITQFTDIYNRSLGIMLANLYL